MWHTIIRHIAHHRARKKPTDNIFSEPWSVMVDLLYDQQRLLSQQLRLSMEREGGNFVSSFSENLKCLTHYAAHHHKLLITMPLYVYLSKGRIGCIWSCIIIAESNNDKSRCRSNFMTHTCDNETITYLNI